MEGTQFNPENRKWTGLGDQQEVNASRQIAAETEFEVRYRTALSTHSHLWIVTMIHYASDQMLRAFMGESGETPILDAETIAMRPNIGCFVCEMPYTKDLAWRKCKGEPDGPARSPR